jgi:rhamnogalacturonan endolyase
MIRRAGRATIRVSPGWPRIGDGYGNRVDRFLAGVAFLDGRRPSMIFGRGYYGRTAIAAWDYRDGQLTERWLFDTDQPGHQDYVDRGNHQLSIADVDGDGRDDVIYGSMAVDADGKDQTQPLYHGDAMHVGDLDPARPGLEKFGVHEQVGRNGGIGSALLDARTGQILWTKPATSDTGRGLSADIDPRHVGEEMWGSNQPDLYDVHGVSVGPHPRQTNFAIWWDGDLLRELLDGTTISKWNWTTGKAEPLLVAEGAASNNGTKANPAPGRPDRRLARGGGVAQRRQSRVAHLYDALADDAPDHHAAPRPGLSRRDRLAEHRL